MFPSAIRPHRSSGDGAAGRSGAALDHAEAGSGAGIALSHVDTTEGGAAAGAGAAQPDAWSCRMPALPVRSHPAAARCASGRASDGPVCGCHPPPPDRPAVGGGPQFDPPVPDDAAGVQLSSVAAEATGSAFQPRQLVVPPPAASTLATIVKGPAVNRSPSRTT